MTVNEFFSSAKTIAALLVIVVGAVFWLGNVHFQAKSASAGVVKLNERLDKAIEEWRQEAKAEALERRELRETMIRLTAAVEGMTRAYERRAGRER